MQKHIKKLIFTVGCLCSLTAFAQNTDVKQTSSLDDFINKKLEENKNFEPYAPAYYDFNSTDKKFKYIIFQSSAINSFHYNEINKALDTREKIKKMQNLALHISDNYSVDLGEAEKIVLTSFTEANKKSIEPLLLLSVIGVESTYKPDARSSAGAVGLTQVMPIYHASKIKTLKKDNLDIWSIQGNIKIGVSILKEYIDLANGNVQKALQMYNGSSSDSSAKYSTKVLKNMKSLSDIAKN